MTQVEVPQLIGLILAGLVVLMGLRAQLGDTPRGERTFRLVMVIFLLVIAGTVFALLRRGGEPVRPDPDAPTTTAALRRPAATRANTDLGQVDNGAAGSHNRRGNGVAARA